MLRGELKERVLLREGKETNEGFMTPRGLHTNDDDRGRH